MATTSTTFDAIRSQMVTTIKALTPLSLSASPYLLTQTERADFRAYANANDQSVFREYDIVDLGTTRLGVADHEVELRETACEIVMAYPHHWGLYQTKAGNNVTNRATLSALIEEDNTLIAKNVGVKGAANYVSGQHAAIETDWLRETGEGVSFAVLPLRVIFYADVS